MKAFIEHEVPQGLGKKSIIILPLDDCSSLIVSIPYDLDTTWIEVMLGLPNPEDGLREILLPDDLAQEILASNESRHNDLDEGITKRLKELADEHRHI